MSLIVSNICNTLIVLTAAGLVMLLLRKKQSGRLTKMEGSLHDKDREIKKLSVENEWLLREVHHRVKNNLQIVTSLLNTQSAYLKNEAALNAVMESQHRIQAISLIHQKLYQSASYSGIYMPDYVNELTAYLKHSFRSKQHIYFNLDIEPIYLDVIRAIPLGLILNELLTNAFKHAFGRSGVGNIKIDLFCSAVEEITLRVADNGNGLPKDFHADETSSFGMTLVKGLTEDLDGIYVIDQVRGTTVSVKFNNKQAAEQELPGILPGSFQLPASCTK